MTDTIHVKEHERKKSERREKQKRALTATIKWAIPLSCAAMAGYITGTTQAVEHVTLAVKCEAPKLPEIITVPVKVKIIDSKKVD